MNTIKRVYISGPMSGLPEHNFPAFHRLAKYLRARGLDVVNPAEINPEPGMTWEACLRNDIRELMTCDTIALMSGWEKSRGANAELHVAHLVGIEVMTAGQVIHHANNLPLIAHGNQTT